MWFALWLTLSLWKRQLWLALWPALFLWLALFLVKRDLVVRLFWLCLFAGVAFFFSFFFFFFVFFFLFLL